MPEPLAGEPGARMILGAIESTWSWTGLVPEEVLRTNAFGNIIVRASDGQIWRLCPEDLSCQVIAASESEYRDLECDPEFRGDWLMERLVELAERDLGPLSDGRCYCLKIPAVLGGTYDISNFEINTIVELVGTAGDMAEQVKDLPDGAQVELVVK